MRGHQRVPSGSQEFKDLTKRDALEQMKNDIERLVSTVPEAQREATKKELDGFSSLFERYLQEKGPSLSWNDIQKLPENAVR